MNSAIIALVSVLALIWGYVFYCRKLEKLWKIDPKRQTPAFSKYDSVDYIPAKNWLMLFGHHFSSIAGAGPIIGPVIAVMLWGWLPTLIWIVLGSIFIGGIHDFGSLVTSIRENGSSIADIAKHSISKRAKVIMSLFVWLALILVIAVFAYLCADTFVKKPRIVLPSLGIIPVALLVGYLFYYKRINTVLVTALGVICLVNLIYAGNVFPINAGLTTWLLILFGYCFVASILPVNILLQPRDYLSSFLLFFGIGAGYLGLVISRPKLTMPYFISYSSTEGYLWPALFVTVACGAVSGFHALISSGTSSKQIATEAHARRIGFGAMSAEALVAILTVIATAAIFNPGDNYAGELKNLSPIGIYGKGYGFLTKSIFGLNGSFIAITILNAFILTTLDTATRICRYIAEEVFNIKNRYFSTIAIIILSAALAFSGKWNRIWPAFGASNQLVAALALFVLSCWLLAKKKPVKMTLLPALFMLLTTIGSLAYQMVKYIRNKDIILLIIILFLISLSGFMLYEVINTFLRKEKHA